MTEPAIPCLQVLIVDDDPISVKLLSLVVERHWGPKAQITGLTDSQEAVAWLAANPCEILITDLHMPQLDGLAVLRQARRRSPMLQAIFVSAVPSVDSVFQAAQDGANDFLLKPVDPAALVDRLDKAETRLVQWRSTMAQTLGLSWPVNVAAAESG